MTLQTGSQSLLAERGRYAVAIAPGKILKALDSNEYADVWLVGFLAALTDGRRDAQRLYVELLGMVGANERQLEIALRAIGVSLEVARRAVSAYQQVEGMDAEQSAEFAFAQLREHYAERGQRLILVIDASAPGGADIDGSGPRPAMITGAPHATDGNGAARS